MIASGAAALALAACASLPAPAPAPELFDFGVLYEQASAVAPQQPHPPLMLAQVTANGLPTSSDLVLYRFAYLDGYALRAYQQARWSRPVEELVAQQLRQQLAQRGPVLEPGVRVRQPDGQIPFVLRVDIEQFEQRFVSAQESEALVRLRATAMAPGEGGDRLLGQQVFTQRVPAATPDAAGGTRAMAIAVQQLGAQLDQWLNTVLPAGRGVGPE
ncbi:hypothetical protein AAV94_05430 [Lampropedia cohaerens]|uniref:ABC-type transport auxiliary lipoprotein component domain-containing protein n=1 Tax=Lampropedia cohaerens TaxID=1610491 RepID=A0A0U1Q182_9BURK|nr:hypothetical protein AAV94_05430 [Lampropedia cohaerens]